MTIYSPKRCDEPCCPPVVRPEFPLLPPSPFGAFADYYAIAPPDNDEVIAAGEAVEFPRGASSDFKAISRIDESSFNLARPGAYLVMFQVSAEDSAQLELSINGTELAYTVAGRAALDTQVNGMAVVTTTQPNSALSLINPTKSTGEVVITQNAGGEIPSSSHLIIVKLA